MRRQLQVTNQSVRTLALAIQALGRRGAISTSTEGFVGAPSKEEKGKLTTCRIMRTALECRIDDGSVIRIPITKRGFRPNSDGEVIAHYEIGPNGAITIYFHTVCRGMKKDGRRYFQRV